MLYASEERAASHQASARDLCATKLFFLFLFGSLVGFLVETAYFLFATGEYLYRGSLVFGPVNTVYGAGALALYFALHRMEQAPWYWVFLVGAVTGTAVEYCCSWAQEAAFGTVSWDYSGMPLNLSGRVWIGASACWGALALGWTYALYPLMRRGLDRFGSHLTQPLALVLLALLVADIALSALAVGRWSLRLEGVPALGWLGQAMDHLFPNAFMERVYEGMQFVGGAR